MTTRQLNRFLAEAYRYFVLDKPLVPGFYIKGIEASAFASKSRTVWLQLQNGNETIKLEIIERKK